MKQEVGNNNFLYGCLRRKIFLHAIHKMAVKEIKVQEMYVCMLIGFCFLSMSFAFDLMTTLWDEDIPLRKVFSKEFACEEDVKLLIDRLSKLPFTNQLKSEAWYKILRYRKVENLNLRDWKKYEPLIPNLPIHMLRRVNFSDEFILKYFGEQKLSSIQLSQLAEEMGKRLGDVLDDEEKILKLGNIFCGFSTQEIISIKQSTLRSLLEKDFFQSIKGCGHEKLSILSKLIKQYPVIGPPRTWEPETVRKAGSLIAGLKPIEIREIEERSFSQISSDVIALTPVETLREIKLSQLKNLNRSALLTYRRKTRDLRKLYMGRSPSCIIKVSFVRVLTTFFVMFLIIKPNF